MENVQTVIADREDSARLRLHRLFFGALDVTPLIDIGTTSLTGLRDNAIPGSCDDGRGLGNPVFRTLALSPQDYRNLGSDFIRTGLLFNRPDITDGIYTDGFGVQWLWEDACCSPLKHPLEKASLSEAVNHPLPRWHQPVQGIGAKAMEFGLAIADAPCSGLLDTCFLLRGTWRFISDLTFDRPMASALLEWSVEAVSQAYEYMLGQLPVPPDVIVYSDDLGFKDNMFFSPPDFRKYLLPNFCTLISRLRNLTSAAICFHSCGSINPILSDIADLGVEIINLDTKAKCMTVRDIRRKLPSTMILHGSNDLCALGAVVTVGDKAGAALLINELTQSAPVIAGPMDNLSSAKDVRNATIGADFIHNLSDDDFGRFRRLGSGHGIINTALEKTLQTKVESP